MTLRKEVGFSYYEYLLDELVNVRFKEKQIIIKCLLARLVGAITLLFKANTESHFQLPVAILKMKQKMFLFSV